LERVLAQLLELEAWYLTAWGMSDSI